LTVAPLEALELLFAACPSYKEEHEEWIDVLRRQEEPFSIHAAYFAHHLVELALRGQSNEFAAVFSMVERLLTEGDEEVRVMTKVAMIEDIQNIASYHDLDLTGFTKLLGPLSQIAWIEIKESWEDFFRRKLAQEQKRT
jgi:hypothetical protein